MSDYSRVAQYYDLAMQGQHGETDTALARALGVVDANAGPILDIGAGTGLTTQALATALPHVEIMAIEPDPAMRAGLMVRLTGDADLTRRVTILPMDALDAPLPKRIGGAVLSASLVHFSPNERRKLWARLAPILTPGCRIVAEIQSPTAVDVPQTEVSRTRLGRHEYVCSVEAARIDSDRQQWTMTYETYADDDVLVRDDVTMICWACSVEELIMEAEASCFSGHASHNIVTLVSSNVPHHS